MAEQNPKFEGKCGEIFKLHNMLEEAEIQHEFWNESYDFPFSPYSRVKYHIYYPSKEDLGRCLAATPELGCSVIEGEGTYGYEKDLLEIMGLLTPEESEVDVVAGSLSADDIFERIRKVEEARRDGFRHVQPSDESED